MAEIYTISGSEFGDAELPVPARDLQCAEQVKMPAFAGGAAMLASAPVGLFGVYKVAKKSGAVGVTALVGAAILFWGGRALFVGAARRFDSCRKA